ncbi:MAG: DUF748 domain-containing protein, partial [Bacteroidetes bacterium]|nr:DUF748 domain-containing protein [Bacteroidota bacterium]
MQRLKKILIITISAIIIFVVVVIVFISPITKYLVEKYDVQYTGREIKMDWAYVNPFTGYVHFSNLRMYELKSDSVFFRSKGLSASFALFKMLHKTYEITKLSLNQPWGIVVQSKKVFNFNDLIEKFTPKKDAPPSAPLHFNILDVSIIDGEFHYLEKVTPVNYFIKKVNFESSGKRWDADTIAAKFSFLPGIGKGDIKGNFTINLNTLRYRFATVVRKFDLSIIQQYMNDIANYGSFSANLDADLKATGNFKNEEDVTAKGLIAINDFHFGKNKKEDYASFDRFVMVMKEVSPLKHIYFYDSVLLTHPYFKYERYDHLDNLQNMFGKKGANYSNVKADPAKFNLIIEIADYVKVLSKNFFKSDYKVNRLAVYKGDLKYNDFAISEKFFMDLNPLYILADSIDKNHKRVNIYLKS